VSPSISLGSGDQIRAFALALALSLVATTSLSAQVCRTAVTEFPRWLAVEYGRASGEAQVIGADVSWHLSESLSLFGDAGITAYPAPAPHRDRLAIGVAFIALTGSQAAACPTIAIEREQISNLTILRVPVGVIVAWSATHSDGQRHLGLHAEPFLVYTRKSIAQWTHTSGLLSGRVGMVLGYRRFFGGIEYENAFDDDAKWNARARLGLVF